jgi:two-component system KDP operon response regulator KdpE
VLQAGSGELILYPQTQTVQVRGRWVALTPTEYVLLLRLAQQAGTMLTLAELLAGEDPLYASDSSYLAAYVWHLRQKLERDPRHPRLLLTIEGVGYLLVP